MTVDVQDKAVSNGKTKGFTPSQSSSSKQDHQARQSSTSQPWVERDDVRLAGMQRVADRALADMEAKANRVSHEYLERAQVLADEISQRMFDMASNRLLFDAIESNLTVLMGTVEKVEKTDMGKRTLQPMQFKLLKPATQANLSQPALTSGDD